MRTTQTPATGLPPSTDGGARFPAGDLAGPANGGDPDVYGRVHLGSAAARGVLYGEPA